MMNNDDTRTNHNEKGPTTAQLFDIITSLQGEIRALKSTQPAMRSAQPHMSTYSIPTPRLPDLPRFSGERSTLRTWTLQAKAKLEELVQAPERTRISFLFGHMTGEAADAMASWAGTGGEDGRTAHGFLQELEGHFGDRRRAEKALDALETLQQGNRPFRDYLADFIRLLNATGMATMWPEAYKVRSSHGA